MQRRYIIIFISGIVGLCLLAGLAYNLPPIHDRLAWRVDNLRVAIKRYLNPPEQVVFVPQEQVDAIVQRNPDGTGSHADRDTSPSADRNAAALTHPQPDANTHPRACSLSGIRHEYQQFNNCAPASLSMVMSYWGWTGSQFETRAYLRPGYEIDDKNVNPFEIVEYVENNTEFDALWRVGGDLGMLKRLLAAGFPVLIEKGLDPAR